MQVSDAFICLDIYSSCVFQKHCEGELSLKKKYMCRAWGGHVNSFMQGYSLEEIFYSPCFRNFPFQWYPALEEISKKYALNEITALENSKGNESS